MDDLNDYLECFDACSDKEQAFILSDEFLDELEEICNLLK